MLKPVAGLDDVDDDQADGERQRRDDLEIDHRLDADAADAFRSPIEAMPCTTVKKMTGVMIILTSLMKPSPSGFSALPKSGKRARSGRPARPRSAPGCRALYHGGLCRTAGRMASAVMGSARPRESGEGGRGIDAVGAGRPTTNIARVQGMSALRCHQSCGARDRTRARHPRRAVSWNSPHFFLAVTGS